MKTISATKNTDVLSGKNEAFIHFEQSNGLTLFIPIAIKAFNELKRIAKARGFSIIKTKGTQYDREIVPLLEM